jgi:hypothetical protein
MLPLNQAQHVYLQRVLPVLIKQFVQPVAEAAKWL